MPLGHRSPILILLVTLAGCTTWVTPPPHPGNPVAVFVADYGRHSSVVLTDEKGTLVEYTYGDWGWYALNHDAPWDGLAAIFWSSRATLGRRELPWPASSQTLTARLKAKHMAEFQADKARVAALLGKLDQRYDQHASTQVYNDKSDFWFVQDDEHYSLFNNCNHLTARWLEALGCHLDGVVFGSDFRVVDK
jgi:hypothetical protein